MTTIIFTMLMGNTAACLMMSNLTKNCSVDYKVEKTTFQNHSAYRCRYVIRCPRKNKQRIRTT